MTLHCIISLYVHDKDDMTRCTSPVTARHVRLTVKRKHALEGCIMWNDTMQYSPEAVRYPCTSCLLPAFDDAWCHVSATE